MTEKIFLPAEDGTFVDNQIMFISNAMNVIYSLNLDTGVIDLQDCIPENDIFAQRLGNKIVKWNEKLFFIPLNANDIWIYNLMEKKWHKIKLKNLGAKQINIKFFQSIVYKKKLFMIGANYPAFVCMDMQTEELRYIQKPYERIIKKMEEMCDISFRSDYVSFGSYIYLGCCLDNFILKFNLDDYSFEWMEVGNKKNRYAGIAWDGQYFWLSPRYGTKLVQWNGEDKVKEYSLPIADQKAGFSLGIICEKNKIIIPNFYERSSIAATIYKDNINLEKWDDVYWFYKKTDDTHKIKFNQNGKLFLEKNKSVSEYRCCVDKEKLIDFFINKAEKGTPYGITIENECFQLDMFCGLIHKSDAVNRWIVNENIGKTILRNI